VQPDAVPPNEIGLMCNPIPRFEVVVT
jgi:hypothetical protein